MRVSTQHNSKPLWLYSEENPPVYGPSSVFCKLSSLRPMCGVGDLYFLYKYFPRWCSEKLASIIILVVTPLIHMVWLSVLISSNCSCSSFIFIENISNLKCLDVDIFLVSRSPFFKIPYYPPSPLQTASVDGAGNKNPDSSQAEMEILRAEVGKALQ